jgi:uncharacterized membrane protein (UPF0127 family)
LWPIVLEEVLLPFAESPNYAADNLTRGITLATCVRVAGNSAQRRRGLLETKSLETGDGLWIAPCEAIHTVGMRWPIDVAFLDRHHRIRKIVRKLAPWRIAICFTAFSVLELPAGVLHPSGTEIGDCLAFRPAQSSPSPD